MRRIINVERFITGPLLTNTYVINDGSSAILIDPGGDLQEITSYIENNVLSLKLVISTHGHFDHIFGVNDLTSKFNAVFMIGGEEGAIMDWSIEVAPSFFGHGIEKPNIGGIISEGRPIRIAEMELIPVHTPGHTPGSYSFILNDSIFTGDTLFRGSIGRTDFGGDMKDMKVSIMKLMNLRNDLTVLPGHGDTTTIAHEIEANPFVSQLLDDHL
jgi:hydroxyacylglutathione hydrolase